jgi:hypothetical protein
MPESKDELSNATETDAVSDVLVCDTVLSLNRLGLHSKTLNVSLRLLQVSGLRNAPFVSKIYAIAVKLLQFGVPVQELEDVLLAR